MCRGNLFKRVYINKDISSSDRHDIRARACTSDDDLMALWDQRCYVCTRVLDGFLIVHDKLHPHLGRWVYMCTTCYENGGSGRVERQGHLPAEYRPARRQQQEKG